MTKIQIKQSLCGVLYISLFLLCACADQGGRVAANESANSVTDSLLGKEVYMPDSLEAYTPFRDSVYMDSAAVARNGSLRVYSFINVSCATCIPDINRWAEEVSSFIKNKVPVILVCFAKDNFEYLKFLTENGKVRVMPFPLYLDREDRFFKANPFIDKNIAHQAVLVNKSGVIIATGNPIESAKAKETYLQKISGH